MLMLWICGLTCNCLRTNEPPPHDRADPCGNPAGSRSEAFYLGVEKITAKLEQIKARGGTIEEPIEFVT
jgi:hypothetical protein